MIRIIVDFLDQTKKYYGISEPVTKGEVAKVRAAYSCVQGHYPEKQQMIVLKSICESVIEAEKKKYKAPIAFAISRVQTGSFAK